MTTSKEITISSSGGLNTVGKFKTNLANLPLVSIVTSVWNGAKTIDKTIQSVLEQTYPNIEYIIIDAGSTDDTVEIIKQYEDRIAYWVSEPDKGIYDAWNKSLKIASGEWIAFLGADDYFMPNAIEAMTRVAIESSQILDYISGKTELTKNGKAWKITGEPYDWKKFKRYVCTGHNGALHNKNLFAQYGEYDISFKSAGDYDMLLRPGKNLKTGYVDVVTSSMAMGGMSNKSSAAIWESYRVILKNKHTPQYIAFLNHYKSLLVWKTKQYFQ